MFRLEAQQSDVCRHRCNRMYTFLKIGQPVCWVCVFNNVMHVLSAGGGASALSKLPSSKSSKSYHSKSYDDEPDRSSGNTKSGGGFAGMTASPCCTARLYSNSDSHACSSQRLLGMALRYSNTHMPALPDKQVLSTVHIV